MSGDDSRLPLPRAILLDLDDTILDDSSLVGDCWRGACDDQAARFAPLHAEVVSHTIRQTSRWFWADAERHRSGRLELEASRREVARLALLELGIDDRSLADRIGDGYSRRRDALMEPLPDAIETVHWLRELGVRLALLTNGAGPAQRKKIVRFGLSGLFDAILVEGELGYGKPDERVFRAALERLAVEPCDAWMIGDNLEWDVAAPQRLGIFAIWIDRRGRGLPPDSAVRPDRVITSLGALKSAVGSRQ
jgi:putative hydrolase of the HAD superfamily